MNRLTVTTYLTLAIVGLWIISAVIRIWIDFPPGMVLDGLMPLVIGYWFVSNSTTKKNGATT